MPNFSNKRNKRLTRIIAGGESDRIKFKESLSGKTEEEIREAISAFANEQLAATKRIEAAQQPTAPVLGILASGKSPQDFLPGAYAQLLRIGGNELADDILDSEDIGGDSVNRRLSHDV